MMARVVVAILSVVFAALVGCSATDRYEVLSFFFDGVPAPESAVRAEGGTATEGRAVRRRVGEWKHGPYAAKLCNACHQAGATNALVTTGDQLCFRCHEFKTEGKIVHGPLASGGCTACHDPHSSRYRYFLLSDSDSFCSYCHTNGTMAKSEMHEGVTEGCTNCHDAHMAEQEYLLK